METSPFAGNRFVLQNTLDLQSRIQDQRIAASTGKKASSFDGISQDVRRLEGLESNRTSNIAFERNVNRTELRLQEMESAVDTVSDVASQFHTQLISAANDGGNLDSIDLETLARDFRDEAQGVLNTELEGRFLFAGSATNTRPIDFANANLQSVKDGDFFKGNDQILSARVQENVTVDYGVTADPKNNTGFQKLFTALQRVIDSPNSPEAVQASIRDLSGGEAQAVLQAGAVSDPDTPLNGANNFAGALTQGGAPPNQTEVNVTVDGSTTTLNIDVTTDSLRDLANQINGVGGVTARVANQEGTQQIEIFADNPEATVSVAAGDAANDSLIGGGNLVQRQNVLVDGAIEELAETRSEIGSTRGFLESTREDLLDTRVRLDGQISDVEDVDLTRVMTLLAQNQTTLNSSFAITARIQQTSLLNFL